MVAHDSLLNFGSLGMGAKGVIIVCNYASCWVLPYHIRLALQLNDAGHPRSGGV